MADDLSKVSKRLGFWIDFGAGVSKGGVELGCFRGMNGGILHDKWMDLHYISKSTNGLEAHIARVTFVPNLPLMYQYDDDVTRTCQP